MAATGDLRRRRQRDFITIAAARKNVIVTAPGRIAPDWVAPAYRSAKVEAAVITSS